MKSLAMWAMVLATSAYAAEKKGHYVFIPADKYDCAYYHWIPPEDCNTWPKGMLFAGGIVYDKHGCAYPKIDGQCDAEMKKQVPSCSQHPPMKPPRIKDPHCPNY